MKREELLFLIEQAVKAPSGHNTQPWIFRLGADEIRIYPDLEKILPVVDANKRELFIALGCASENIRIAASAHGYETKIQLTKDGMITLRFAPNEVPAEDVNLLNQIDARHTNRGLYKGECIAENVINSILDYPLEKNIGLHIWPKSSKEYEILTHYILEGNRQQMRNREFIRELKAWMRFNRAESEKTKDGLSYAVFGAPNLPACISKVIMGACLHPGIQNK